MAKPFKIFLWIVGGLIALLAAVAIAVPLLFDPNDYRGQISEAAKEETGRELEIKGDIKLSVFPWLSVEVNEIVLGNAKGFGPEPFASIAKLDAGVRLLPLLLDRKVMIGTVTLKGLALNLAKAKDGSNNWSDLAQSKKTETQETSEKPAGPPPDLSVGGLNIEDARLSYTDAQTGAAQTIEKLSLKTGPVELGKPLDIALSLLATSNQPEIAADVKLTLTAVADMAAKVYEAKDLKLDVTASGGAIPAGKQMLTMRGNARYEQNTGALSLPDLVLEAAGLVLNAAVQGDGLGGESPKLSGKLSTNTFSPRELTRKLGIELPSATDPSVLSEASFSADYTGDFTSAKLDNLALKLDQTSATGYVHVTDFTTQAIRFALKMDTLDVDRYLPPASEAEKAAQSKGDAPQPEIPVDALDSVNARGTVELASLKLKGAQLSSVKLELDAPKGKVKTQELTAQLYGGRITQSARITPGAQPKYDIKAGLLSVNTGPLLKDVAGKNFLSGAGNFNLGVTTGGKTLDDLLKTLNGALSTSLANGAIEGFNMKQTIAQARALSKGQAMPASDAPARTEFSDLKGSGKLVNGVLKTDTLNAKGADYTLTGDGDVDLVGQQINYVLKPTYTAGSEQGVTLPVRITGNLFDPKVRVDVAGLVKDQTRQEIKKQEDKIKQKLGDKLGDFLRKSQPPPEPAPAPEQPPAQPPPAEQPPAQ